MVTVWMCTYCQVNIVTSIIIIQMLFYYSSITCITSINQYDELFITNIVSDKINIISNKDENRFNVTDQESLIKEEELDEIMSKLHQIPHGDTLIKLLDIIIKAIVSHVHPYAGRPAIMEGYVKDAADFSLPTILSKHVRIS